MKILKEVLVGIKPSVSEEKEVNEKIRVFVSKLNKNLRDGKAVLGGSGAKETWLSNAHDADVFVQFNYKKYKDKSDKLSDILEKVLKKSFGKVSRLHGSRDYFQIKEKKFTFEVVPILHINKSQDALNITDVSPLHANWVKKYKHFADEIRLTKQFCKAIGVYGAESYIKGFSGYICEILTINYGGFLKLVRAASKWKEKSFIDVQKYYKNKNDAMLSVNKSKQQGPMIVIDPVQKDRNAAAALDEKMYLQFIDFCKGFLRKPSKKYFEIAEFDVGKIKKEWILLKVEALKGKQDVIGSKLLKAVEFINKELVKNDFKVKDYGWYWNKKAYFWFNVDNKELSTIVERQGPPVKFEKGVNEFKKKHKNTFVKKGIVFSKDKRKFRDAKKFVKLLIKEEYVKEKVKTISSS